MNENRASLHSQKEEVGLKLDDQMISQTTSLWQQEDDQKFETSSSSAEMCSDDDSEIENNRPSDYEESQGTSAKRSSRRNATSPHESQSDVDDIHPMDIDQSQDEDNIDQKAPKLCQSKSMTNNEFRELQPDD